MKAIIVAADLNGAIGKEGKLPWVLKRDLNYFKKKTVNQMVVMGRKTFDSIGKLLPFRKNIIITKNKQFSKESATVFYDFKSMIAVVDYWQKDTYFIGGSEIYAQALPFIDRIFYTEVQTEIVNADTFFPKIDWNEWELVSEKSYPADNHNEYPFVTKEFLRK